jgi:hypothetical protein
MTFPAQLNAALSALAASGLPEHSYAPPLHRVAWRLGWYVPPPHLASFSTNVAFFGVCFGFAWGALMSVAVWAPRDMPVLIQTVGSVIGGLLFGLSMAEVYRRGARKHRLPQWSHFA